MSWKQTGACALAAFALLAALDAARQTGELAWHVAAALLFVVVLVIVSHNGND